MNVTRRRGTWTSWLALLLAAGLSVSVTGTSQANENADEGTKGTPFRAIVVEGVGRDRDEAAKNALRNALRQTLGSFVEVDTLVQNEMWVEDHLLAHALGFVDKYEKLSERHEDGLFRVIVKVQVKRARLAARLKTANILVAAKKVTSQQPAEAVADPEEPDDPVSLGLLWLARHQNGNGSWSFNHTPGDRCSGFPNPGNKASKFGATGLALLPFLAKGYTHEKNSPYQKTVRDGLAYLISHMDAETGRLYEADGEAHTHMYCHGIAAYALIEAYGRTRDKKLAAAAQMALNYIVNAQGKGGGWRYLPKEPGDTSVLGWQIMALKSGKMSYLTTVPDHVYPKAMKFLDGVQEAEGAKYRYMKNAGHGSTPALTASGLLSRGYMGWPQDHAAIQAGVKAISEKGPHPTDMYYNYFGSMFLRLADVSGHAPQRHGPALRKWTETMVKQLNESQEIKGGIHRMGSWYFDHDSGHREGKAGGRLYDTAMAILAREAATRRW